jgi:MFS family permease
MARKWWTLLAVCVATFMLLLDITVVNVALPDIQSSLGASLSSLQWVVDAYSLTLAAFLLTAGSRPFSAVSRRTRRCSTWPAAFRGSAARRCSPRRSR